MIVPSRHLRLLFLAAAATMVFLLFWLGAQPIAVDLFPEPWDKLAHFATYGAITILLALGLVRRRPFTVVVFVSLIGALDEWHQIYLPGRSASVADWLADFAAAVVAMSLLEWLRLRTLSTAMARS